MNERFQVAEDRGTLAEAELVRLRDSELRLRGQLSAVQVAFPGIQAEIDTIGRANQSIARQVAAAKIGIQASSLQDPNRL